MKNQITTLIETTPDGLGFFESVKLSNLENQQFRMSYKQQRYFFGYVPFGKKRITVKPNGAIQLIWKLDFGQDWDIRNLCWSQSKRKLLPF